MSMTDVGGGSATPVGADVADRRSGGHQILRHRGLPGGRAVVGALLVAAAAVAVFAAYLGAVSDPDTHYLVANGPIAPGTMVEDGSMARELFSSAAIDLAPPVDQRILLVEEIDGLVGTVVSVPLQRGDLLHRTAILDAGGVSDVQVMSFSLPRSDALAGDLAAGETLDVLATYNLGGEAFTAFVLRGIPLLDVHGESGTTGGPVTLTVGASGLEDIQALGHAVNTASVFVTRAVDDPGRDRAPGPYRPSLDSRGPVPDPAGSLASPDGAAPPGAVGPTTSGEPPVPEGHRDDDATSDSASERSQ